jgi:hypothetical protein
LLGQESEDAEGMGEVQVYADKQVDISRDGSGSLAVAGSIDYFNADAVARWLSAEIGRAMPGDVLDGAAQASAAVSLPGDLLLDLSRLEFSDVTGIRALVRVAEHAAQGRRLVLRGLPPQIARVMAVVGWSESPKLVVEQP